MTSTIMRTSPEDDRDGSDLTDPVTQPQPQPKR